MGTEAYERPDPARVTGDPFPWLHWSADGADLSETPLALFANPALPKWAFNCEACMLEWPGRQDGCVDCADGAPPKRPEPEPWW